MKLLTILFKNALELDDNTPLG